ncbi:AbrB family transcriptional regulator [Gordonia sp. L191]|uniref:AbrB family transcriptional regulator n=1 Tax=Gordonia sp. L191 TaxID=2982699 RepID=UPI0024BF2DE5|nr:AbrB family transcriptional regulator [Gordonia sp. L191]WHU47077.1 AbrB family transcriptional regulator [Gordonia sp. L191]
MVTVGVGAVFTELRMPGSWLVAAAIAAGMVAIIGGQELTPHRWALRPGQSIIGILAAAPLATVGAGTAQRYLIVSIAVSAATLALCLGCARVVAWAGRGAVSPATAVLSTLAGGASGISTMAVDLDVDHRYVAFSQYLRLVVVTVTLPFVLIAIGLHPQRSTAVGHAPSVLGLAVAVAIVALAGRIGARLSVPAPYLLMPLMVTLVVELAVPGLRFDLPSLVVAVAYVVIGWQAGGSFTRASLRLFVRLLPVTAVLIGVMMGACFAMAVGVAVWLHISLGQSYLATTPGGIYAVMATATDTGAGPVVSTLQVIRLLTMVFAAAIAARVFSDRTQIGRRLGSRDRAEAPSVAAPSVDTRLG